MKHEEKRIINHTPQNLYNLVSDVKKYPEFLPWCLGARIKNLLKNLIKKDIPPESFTQSLYTGLCSACHLAKRWALLSKSAGLNDHNASISKGG